MDKTIKVLFAITEADPLIKVGGLGDVGGSLPQALRALPPEKLDGWSMDVRLVLPFHAAVHDRVPHPQKITEFNIPRLDHTVHCEVFQHDLNGVPVYLVDGPPMLTGGAGYVGDPLIDGEKYTFFSLAILEMCSLIGWIPDILHTHDWHAALANYLLNRQRPPAWQYTRSLITIHNLPYMGGGTESVLYAYHIPPANDPALPAWGHYQPLPMGLLTADYITTVSPTYAREILRQDYGCGLDRFLQSRQDSLSGIINGLDLERWNPENDTTLAATFNIDQLNMRQYNKMALTREFNLDYDPAMPLLAFVGRLDMQKGIDFAITALRQCAHLPWQVILLGTGSPELENACRELERDYPDRVRAAIRFDSALSHRIYAGSDILLMPSRYEPCGLSQMIAMRYGCLPLARATGGLKDTIFDDPSGQNGVGFLFEEASSGSMLHALTRALITFAQPDTWLGMQQRAMRRDISWTNSALQYAQIYRQLARFL